MKRGDASVNGDPGVVITIVKQPHADTRALTAAVRRGARARSSRRCRPTSSLEPDLFQLRDFIDRGIYNVGEALVIGAVLVLIILFLFLLNFRTTFITLTAIPLSLVVTALVFRLIGALTGTELSINVMTLGGIAVAMGELVDDAIVDVENIFRRLRENNPSPRPEAGAARGLRGQRRDPLGASCSARRSSSSCSCRCSPCRASRAGCSRRWASPTSCRFSRRCWCR